MLYSPQHLNKISKWQWIDKDTVSSTNDEVKMIATKETPIVISAIKQTNGRGRRGNNWQSQEGNLYFSYSQTISVNELSRYVCIIGLVLAKTIKEQSQNINVQIKWPNDIYINNQKVSGILIENIKDDLWVIGIGVNIKKTPKLDDQILYKATSLKDNSINLDRKEFLFYYLTNLEKELKQYKIQGFTYIKQEWLNYALNYGKEITIKNETTTKKGIFVSIDDNGYLIIKTKKGKEHIIAGELFI